MAEWNRGVMTRLRYRLWEVPKGRMWIVEAPEEATVGMLYEAVAEALGARPRVITVDGRPLYDASRRLTEYMYQKDMLVAFMPPEHGGETGDGR